MPNTDATTTTAASYGYWVNELDNGTSITTSTCTGDTWRTWNSSNDCFTATIVLDGSSTTVDPWVQWTEHKIVSRRRETEEEIAQREIEREAAAQRQRENELRLSAIDAKKKEAERKAFKLLSENLTKTQLKSLNKDGFFLIKAPSGNEYNIHKGRIQNIVSLDEFRKKKHTLCAHPNTDCPDYDTMLAQKLMLEHKEKDFLAVANVS